MPTDPSHLLYHQRNDRERKILKNKAFISAFGSPSQIKHNKQLSSSKKSNSLSSIKSKSSSNTLNSPGHQSSDFRKTAKSKTTLKLISNNEAYIDRLVPDVKLLVKKYPRFKTLPITVVDLPEALLRDIMIKANLQNKYVLRSWIETEHLNMGNLCLNPNAISFLEELYKLPKELYDKLDYTKKINWKLLCLNKNAMFLIKKRIDYEKTLTNEEISKTDSNYIINWNYLSSNQNAIDVLKHKITEEKTQGERIIAKLNDNRKIDWSSLSANPNAILLLKKNEEKIVWNAFYINKNLDIDLFEKRLLKIKEGEVVIQNLEWYAMWSIPISTAIDLLNKIFPEKINYYNLSKNPCTSSIKLLLVNKENIIWNNLSSNTHPEAIKLLAANINEIDWMTLAQNTNKDAIKIIEDNISKLPRDITDNIWFFLSSNPKAIKLLEANPTKINLTKLCWNHNAVKLIKMNKDRLRIHNYGVLSKNPCIFIEK
jgi:hypothetical protein